MWSASNSAFSFASSYLSEMSLDENMEDKKIKLVQEKGIVPLRRAIAILLSGRQIPVSHHSNNRLRPRQVPVSWPLSEHHSSSKTVK